MRDRTSLRGDNAAAAWSWRSAHVGLLLLVSTSVTAASPLPPFMRAVANGRSLTLCERKDDTDSSITKCDEWCKYPEHCSYCKCRACSMCQPCTSDVPDDIQWEGCENWCSVHDHCSSCKCRACSFCRACTPVDDSDTPYEDSQPWCTDKAHCEFCKVSHRPVLQDCAQNGQHSPLTGHVLVLTTGLLESNA